MRACVRCGGVGWPEAGFRTTPVKHVEGNAVQGKLLSQAFPPAMQDSMVAQQRCPAPLGVASSGGGAEELQK